MDEDEAKGEKRTAPLCCARGGVPSGEADEKEAAAAEQGVGLTGEARGSCGCGEATNEALVGLQVGRRCTPPLLRLIAASDTSRGPVVSCCVETNGGSCIAVGIAARPACVISCAFRCCAAGGGGVGTM